MNTRCTSACGNDYDCPHGEAESRETEPIDPLPGRPLMMRDILMECLNYEDRLRERTEARASVVPPSVNRPMPKQHWSPAAAHVFRRGIFRRTLSIMLP